MQCRTDFQSAFKRARALVESRMWKDGFGLVPRGVRDPSSLVWWTGCDQKLRPEGHTERDRADTMESCAFPRTGTRTQLHVKGRQRLYFCTPPLAQISGSAGTPMRGWGTDAIRHAGTERRSRRQIGSLDESGQRPPAPSLPDARRSSDRPRYGGREGNSLQPDREILKDVE